MAAHISYVRGMKVTSDTCISTTRDPATERIQNSLFCVVWSPASKSFMIVTCKYELQELPCADCILKGLSTLPSGTNYTSLTSTNQDFNSLAI